MCGRAVLFLLVCVLSNKREAIAVFWLTPECRFLIYKDFSAKEIVSYLVNGSHSRSFKKHWSQLLMNTHSRVNLKPAIKRSIQFSLPRT